MWFQVFQLAQNGKKWKNGMEMEKNRTEMEKWKKNGT